MVRSVSLIEDPGKWQSSKGEAYIEVKFEEI